MKINTIQFCSDLHLGHKFAALARGFNLDINKHNEIIIQSIAKTANKRTITWILGDVCMRIEDMPLLMRIPGRLKLVRGNHDQFNMGVYNQYFEETHGLTRYKRFWLSHCPIHPQEMYKNIGNIHGHIHKNTRSPFLSLPYFNVNWDFWKRAVSLEEIQQIFTKYNSNWYIKLLYKLNILSYVNTN